MGFLLILGVTVLVIWIISQANKSSESKSSTANGLGLTITVQSGNSGISTPPIKTGAIKGSREEGWVINPRSPFPLTIIDASKETASELKRMLDERVNGVVGRGDRDLIEYVAKTNIRCKEVEEYVERYKPNYEARIKELIAASSDWSNASEKDKGDLLTGFQMEAQDSLHVRPYMGVEELFEGRPEDLTVDDALLERYGFDTARFYLRHSDNPSKVHVAPADHRDRSRFDALVEVGLAKRGADIAMDLMLSGLALKDLNAIADGIAEGPFKRKAKAVEAILLLPDVRERVSRHVSFRELFQLVPLPAEFSGIDLKKVAASWRYADYLSELLSHTYTMGAYSIRDNDAHRSDDFIRGWRISDANDANTCPYCKEAAKKAYPRGSKPTPFHLGCRCCPIAELT